MKYADASKNILEDKSPMASKYDLIIYGCGGHARSVVDVLVCDRPDISICLVDEHAAVDEIIAGFPVVRGGVSGSGCFIAIGDNHQRAALLKNCPEQNLVSIISSKSHVGKAAQIARGSFVGNFAHVGPEVVVGKGTIVNTGAVVEHETLIGALCHIGPNASISGRCKIGDLVFIGAGATVIDSTSICSEVIIGAGSVVVQSITEPGTYVGCPARRIK